MVDITIPKTYAAMNESYNQPAPSYENGNMFTALGETNLMTGDAVLKVAAKKATDLQFNYNNAFLVMQAQIGVSLPIGQVSADIGNCQNALTAGVVAGVANIVGR